MRVHIQNGQKVQINEDDQNKGSRWCGNPPGHDSDRNQSKYIEDHEKPVAIYPELFESSEIFEFPVDFLRRTHLSSYEKPSND